MADFRNFSALEPLRDGLTVTVRAVRPDDKDRIVAAFQALESSPSIRSDVVLAQPRFGVDGVNEFSWPPI